MSETIVKATDLTKVFQRGQMKVMALERVDTEIHRGEFVALMGPSGSGKSTLLHLIAGMDNTHGQLVVLGEPAGMTEQAWRGGTITWGLCFRRLALIPVLTALENVALPLKLTSLYRERAWQRGMHFWQRLNRKQNRIRLDHFPRQLSGGQEQRVAIARAIVTDPDLILADEPTGNLDSTSAAEVLALLQQLNKEFNKTIIMVTHDPHAAQAASRLIHLDKGKFVESPTASPAAV